MKDPCDECLVKVNCSEFCWEKKNYTTLIRNAYEMHNRFPQSNVKVASSFYKKYWKNEMNSMNIKRRGLKRHENS